jgi:hypothetical protein
VAPPATTRPTTMTPAALPDESAGAEGAGRPGSTREAGTRGAFAPDAFAGRLALFVVLFLVARAGLVLLLHRADLAHGYRWDSFLAAVPGMLAGIVLGSRTSRRASASWAAVAQVAVAIALVHLALSLLMGRLAGFARPPQGPLDGGVMLGVAAFNAGLAICIGAWAGRRMTRLGDRLGA